MRKLIAALLVLPLLWAGYWVVGSSGLKSEIQKWLSDRQSDGWQVEYADLSVRGFPNRFDTTLDQINLTDPETGISWTAPFFQMLSLSYKPNHLIAVWPNTQMFSTPFQKISISSEDMKASLVLAPNTEMTLQRGTLISSDIRLISNLDWEVSIDGFSASIRQLETSNSYEFNTAINMLRPSKGLLNWLDQNDNLPDFIENVSIDFSTELSHPLDRTTLEDARPQIKSLEISQAKASWGELVLRTTGDLTVDGDGKMSGELALNAKNWREMIQMASSSGAISSEIASAAEFGLGLVARLNGSDETLDTTLTFKDGRMFLGPIPLGSAPRLVIR